MAAKNKGLSNPYVKVNRRKRIGFNFSDKHKRYIKIVRTVPTISWKVLFVPVRR